MRLADDWKDYKVLSTGDGYKLEKWGEFNLLRPDPQVIWHAESDLFKRKDVDAFYEKKEGGGLWHYKKPLKDNWQISWHELKFIVKPMGFKHTGIFPEQAVNWRLMQDLVKESGREVKVLNLFAYTGGASVALSKAGALVTHVDASKGMVERAKENAKLNNISNIRFIVDDCQKFIEREIRRGNFYDAIVMDPPSYGRGPSGEMWKLEDNLADFVALTKKVLSKNPLFVLINSYTTGLQPTVIGNLLKGVFGAEGVSADEIGLPTCEEYILPCGATGVKVWKN